MNDYDILRSAEALGIIDLDDIQVQIDMYALSGYLEDVGYGTDKSIFVVYPGENGNLSVYSSFYDEETHSLKFLTDRLGPAVLVAYEAKDQESLMESEDFLKTLHDAALSFPAQVDWRNSGDYDLYLQA